jgi:[protein-PII] uridylyltransferase
MEKLNARGIDASDATRLWEVAGEDFFLRHTPRQVAEITERMYRHRVEDGPLVMLVELKGLGPNDGATEIVLYTEDQPNLFAASVAALSQLDLSVQDASIHTADNGLCLNTYVVLGEDGNTLTWEAGQRDRLAESLSRELADPADYSAVMTRRTPRRLRQLTRATEVKLRNRRGTRHSELTIIASDRPGLLASIGQLFSEMGISVQSARITTLGERIDDVFDIVDENGKAIRDRERIYLLENALRQSLDNQIAQNATNR